MEIAFAADHTAVRQKVAGPNISILSNFFNVQTEVSFIFKESIDRFLSCCHEPHLINSLLESFNFRWFSLIQLLMLASVFPFT